MARLISHLKPWYWVSSLSRTSATPKTQVITRTATGGNVDITVNGETISAVSIVAATTAAQVKSALVSTDSIDDADIAVTGSAGGPFTVAGSIGNIDIDDDNATGGTVTVAPGTSFSRGDDYIVPIGSLDSDADITEAIRAFAGWSFEANDVDVPDFSSKFPKTIPGLYAKSTPSLDIYRNDDPSSKDAEVEALLVEGATGFMVRSLNGDPAEGVEVQVWPVTVKSAIANGDSDATTGKEQTTKVMFSVTDEPELHATVTA